jgi:hypothetical protein
MGHDGTPHDGLVLDPREKKNKHQGHGRTLLYIMHGNITKMIITVSFFFGKFCLGALTLGIDLTNYPRIANYNTIG